MTSPAQPERLRALICGGRDFADWEHLCSVLDKGHQGGRIVLVIHGGARGADTLASDWAMLRCVPSLCYPANWSKHGDAAGPIRNEQMLRDGRPDVVIAFPGGKGTAHMCKIARAAGVKVVEVPPVPKAPSGKASPGAPMQLPGMPKPQHRTRSADELRAEIAAERAPAPKPPEPPPDAGDAWEPDE